MKIFRQEDGTFELMQFNGICSDAYIQPKDVEAYRVEVSVQSGELKEYEEDYECKFVQVGVLY